ncbi:glycosyltransferase [Marivirga arenosa]|uniref:Glycosyltransferase n=1 Tax=Marivirga arenosa TaxID=3059076 RepID=A0AA49GEL2_9BACT|nr:glycosyltransferase [Marivirga sp. ABR2-2]WKK86011.2 glycosyltransferase [Marivirga sp. ABR2-2]
MKILIVVNNYLSPSMTFIYNQVKSFSQKNEVKVIGSEINNIHLFPYHDLVQIPYRKFNSSNLISMIKRKLKIEYTGNNAGYTKSLVREIESFKPDIIHTHFGLQLIRIAKAVEKTNTKTIVTFHGYDASQLLRNKLYVKELRRIFNFPNVFGTTVSANMKDRLAQHGLPPEKLFVDYLGVDVNFFEPKEKIENRKKTFLQVSNFLPKKGHEFTIKAFARFLDKANRKDYRLILAGAGPLLDEMQQLTKKLNIDKFVSFPGLVNRTEVKDLMQHADFFVHHSVTAPNGDSEGIPTVIMEAMAMKLPILSTFHSGISELVENGKDGILVREKDVSAFAHAFSEIQNINVNPDSIRKKIVGKFNLYKQSFNLLTLIESLN